MQEKHDINRLSDKYIYEVALQLPQIKGDILAIQKFCERIERSVDKFVGKQEQIVEKIYIDMEDSRKEFRNDIEVVNDRIDKLEEKIHDRLNKNEDKIMNELVKLEDQIHQINNGDKTIDVKNDNNKDKTFELLNEWKTRLAIGFVVIVYMFEHFDLFEKIHKFFT